MAETYHRPQVRVVDTRSYSMGYMSEYRVSCACGWEPKKGFETEEDALEDHTKHVAKVRSKKYVYLVFGSTGFMDSQKGGLLEVFDNEGAAHTYASQMMGIVEKWEIHHRSPFPREA